MSVQPGYNRFLKFALKIYSRTGLTTLAFHFILDYKYPEQDTYRTYFLIPAEIIPIRLHSIRELGNLLRSKRKQAGHSSLIAGAKAFSVGKRFLSELERGKATAEIGKVLDVLHCLGLDLAVIDRTIDTASSVPALHNPRSRDLGLDFPYDWSNQTMDEDTLIYAVLEKARFMDVLHLVQHFGTERIETLAANHMASLPNWPRLQQILERIREAKDRLAG
jgi:hypothetical protein